MVLLTGREPKEVYHYANETNPERCYIRLYKLYNSKCPPNRPPNAFYLTPLARPKENLWYSRSPLGHNTLTKIVSSLMSEAGFEGHYSNHSLRVSRTGHSSTDGVRAYKRTSNTLKQLTSDVLNGAGGSKDKCLQPEGSPKPKKLCAQDKENSTTPTFVISGRKNITINIGQLLVCFLNFSLNCTCCYCLWLNDIHEVLIDLTTGF